MQSELESPSTASPSKSVLCIYIGTVPNSLAELPSYLTCSTVVFLAFEAVLHSPLGGVTGLEASLSQLSAKAAGEAAKQPTINYSFKSL